MDVIHDLNHLQTAKWSYGGAEAKNTLPALLQCLTSATSCKNVAQPPVLRVNFHLVTSWHGAAWANASKLGTLNKKFSFNNKRKLLVIRLHHESILSQVVEPRLSHSVTTQAIRDVVHLSVFIVNASQHKLQVRTNSNSKRNMAFQCFHSSSAFNLLACKAR